MTVLATGALILGLAAITACSSSRDATDEAVMRSAHVESAKLVIDGWWDVDYALNSCGDDKVCQTSRAVEIGGLHRELMTQFAAQATCSGIFAMIYEGPSHPSPDVDKAMARHDHWVLSISYQSNADKQYWSLSTPGSTNNILQGTADVEHMATQVCNIIKGRGAQLAS
jgi:hypothetical protein